MKFNRVIYKDLKKWQKKKARKPILMLGARQIGKTTAIKEFGKQNYSDLIYLNLEKQLNVHKFFTGNKDPEKILRNISLLHGNDILQQTSLIILDEIQECRDALIALKYFAEEKPDIHIIGAGSLLGLTIGNNRSFPVGKVEFLQMYPLTFDEFLESANPKLHSAFHSYLQNDIVEPLQDAFFLPLQKLHEEYILFGGMPEVAATYLQNRNIEEAQIIQDHILQAYELDFVKHAPKTTSTKIQRIWNSLPSQLARENKKFLYKVVRSGARARDYEEAIQWLVEAGLVYKVSRVEKPNTPLKAYEDVTSFKLYLFETGLLIRLAGLDPKTFIYGDPLFTHFKGSLAENYVAQGLKMALGKSPYYWTSKGKAEIDYIISRKGINIPIEVKSGTATKAKSLATYKKMYQPQLSVRVSNLNLKESDGFLNIPLFYSDQATMLIDKVVDNI